MKSKLPPRSDLLIIGFLVLAILTGALGADGYRLKQGMVRPTNSVPVLVK